LLRRIGECHRLESVDQKESRMPIPTSDGGCICGAIRYRTTGQPTNSMICHCRTCRRVAASPVVAWVTFPVARYQIVQGTPSLFRSSPHVLRTFCAACGSPLTYEHSDSSGFIDITTCSFDVPDAFPPTHHSWLSHDVAWVKFGDGLPAYQQSKT
jgi:hypothetical protein